MKLPCDKQEPVENLAKKRVAADEIGGYDLWKSTIFLVVHIVLSVVLTVKGPGVGLMYMYFEMMGFHDIQYIYNCHHKWLNL